MVASIDFDQRRSFTESIWRLSVAQYHSMLEHGIFAQDAQVELLEGLLVAKMPKNPPHRLSTGLLQDVLLSNLPSNYHLNLQEPLTLADSEPEPDLAVVVGSRLDYRDRHPQGQEVALVVEVADSSLERDRTLKQGIYAKPGIPNYWILNLSDRTLEVYTDPSDAGRYRQRQVLTETETMTFTLNQAAIASFKVARVL
ncbi:MAG: Uma2 family endonuclease [Pseudanabaenaceae cyanobacterium bins.68]|nr:Uma2 family endonuclease [Pseudanabaenaceae cyanobacterium bins.68]